MKRQADAENRKANLAKRKADRQSKKEQENEALEQRAKQAKLPHRLDKLPAECLVDVEVVTDRALLQKMDGTQPFVVRDLKLASDALVALHRDDTLRLAREKLQKQYQTTTAFKSTGRAHVGWAHSAALPSRQRTWRTLIVSHCLAVRPTCTLLRTNTRGLAKLG